MYSCLIDLQLILISVEYSFFLYVSTLFKTKRSFKVPSRQYSVIFRFQTGKFHFKKSGSQPKYTETKMHHGYFR